MADCKRIAAIDTSSSAPASPSKKRKLTASPTMLRQLLDSPTKLLRSTISSSILCSGEHEHERSPSSSCCSSNEFNDVVFGSSPLPDLKQAKSCETVHSSDSTPAKSNKFRRETTPSSELCLKSPDKMESAAVTVVNRAPAASKAPPSDEIEEFFAAAEKYEQKRFAEKYNFDVANDAPLEGRYQWVRSKP